MGLTDTRIRSLETARECARLGARQRTIAWLTGLPTSFIFHHVFDAEHLPPRGRPPYTEDIIYRASLKVQTEVSMFAAKYRQLTGENIAPAKALITAYWHYRLIVSRSSFSFDEAFFVASNLDGIWAATTRTLELGACRRCDCMHLIPRGALPAPAGCPYCRPHRTGRTSARRQPRSDYPPQASGTSADAVTAPVALDAQITTMRTELVFQQLGAHPRVVAALTAASTPPATNKSAPWPQGHLHVGHPVNLHRWGVAVKTVQRAQFSLVATAYIRLLAATMEPTAALRAAFMHVAAMFPTAPPLSFDRCFEVISILDARWGATEPALDLLFCTKCRANFLASRTDRERPHCPFCALLRTPQKYL